MYSVPVVSLHRVSIHAPVRGATSFMRQYGMTTDVSIHAPVRGATRQPMSIERHEKFRSTPLYEGRLAGTGTGAARTCFDPRPCTRGDGRTGGGGYVCHRFDPRPFTRGDSARVGCSPSGTVSIHAPVRGAGPVFCPPGEQRELMAGLTISFSMWQCGGHGDAAGPGFLH